MKNSEKINFFSGLGRFEANLIIRQSDVPNGYKL